MINQFGSVFVGKTNVIGLIFAVVILALMIYMQIGRASCRERV